jgi:hypothetical protein
VTGSVSGDYQKITNKLGIELPMIEWLFFYLDIYLKLIL